MGPRPSTCATPMTRYAAGAKWTTWRRTTSTCRAGRSGRVIRHGSGVAVPRSVPGALNSAIEVAVEGASAGDRVMPTPGEERDRILRRLGKRVLQCYLAVGSTAGRAVGVG